MSKHWASCHVNGALPLFQSFTNSRGAETETVGGRDILGNVLFFLMPRYVSVSGHSRNIHVWLSVRMGGRMCMG